MLQCMVDAIPTSRQTENPEPSSHREIRTFLAQRNQDLEPFLAVQSRTFLVLMVRNQINASVLYSLELLYYCHAWRPDCASADSLNIHSVYNSGELRQ